MKRIKAGFRLFLVTIYILSSYVVYLPLYLIVRVLGVRYEPLRNVYMRALAIVCPFILNIKIRTEGTPPEPPFFLVSNHLSYVDIIPLYRNLKCTFVAKREVRYWPVLGFMVKTMGVIFIDRKRKKDVTRVNEMISRSLNKDQGIVLFPEGTTSPGEVLLPFRAPLLEYPATHQLPVYYATINYKTQKKDLPAEESVCWFGGKSFFGHMYKLASNTKTECVITFGDESVTNSDRKALAEQLHSRMADQFVPTMKTDGL